MLIRAEENAEITQGERAEASWSLSYGKRAGGLYIANCIGRKKSPAEKSVF